MMHGALTDKFNKRNERKFCLGSKKLWKSAAMVKWDDGCLSKGEAKAIKQYVDDTIN